MLYSLLKPLLFRLDAERAHDLITGMLHVAGRTPLVPQILRAIYAYDDPILAIECAGLRFANPVGLAAGFDKHAALIEPMAALGFGYVEVGTVTPRAQPGNPRPRLFRLPEDSALINRFGFNSLGMVTIAHRLREQNATIPVGVNIGKNLATPLERAIEDYIAGFIALAPLADYVTINISSPNTPGLRRLQERAAIESLLYELTNLNHKFPYPRPLFFKLSPDTTSSQLEDIVQAGCEASIDGFIVVNTALAREGLRSPLQSEPGGLSGRPLAARAQHMAARIYRMTDGALPVIGVGGVASAADAYAHIRAGASLVQLYTGLVYNGPGLIYTIKRNLVKLLQHDGYRAVSEAIGVDQK
jgi:dihydroorotate dehydrogenase